ncbi:Aldehyde dehydrogenase, mitochondrial [Schistosoma haematobium]|uniref:Aldehyde dehydrogenase, mitochondrial n=1 Tax=Schistosoma haematobium TaxID=6185 RepID=A0A922IIW6_SCHHA|nr:Aldehyde dehydrogenase, mitochondrial [Schistosoma haematobium]KAH9579507.1 Aldehyde dehydrogenase, mitochondrial [Schistosoma haematobium]
MDCTGFLRLYLVSFTFGETAGNALVIHPDVDKIAFTGSTAVGQLIGQNAYKHGVKRITLELGGKSPLIIFSDGDFDRAIATSHFGLFFNQGQCCCASSRIFVEESVYDKFVEYSSEEAKKRVVGNPFDLNTTQGPQVDEHQYRTVMSYIESGIKEGAKLCAGGKRFESDGYFIRPTVFADVQDEMRIAREEIFGPVMQIMKFRSLDELIHRANHTQYGLAAGIFTNNLEKAMHVMQHLQAGTVWINCYDVFDAAAPFGGYKFSGVGRELGEYGLRNYTEVKTDDKIPASEIYVKGDYKIDSKNSFDIVFSGDIASMQSMLNEKNRLRENCCRHVDFYHMITHSDKRLNEQEHYEQQRN